MLSSANVKVIRYFPKSNEVFTTTDIKGGVAITYIDKEKLYSPIGIFTGNQSLDSILHKVINYPSFASIQPEVLSRTSYRLTSKLHHDYPEAKTKLSKGHQFDMSTNIFDRLPEVFVDNPSHLEDYISVIGRLGKSRVIKYIKREYVNQVINLDKYKVYTPSGSDGLSILGEKPIVILGPSQIGPPGMAATETFISVGSFDNLESAENCLAYLKTKFARTLIAVLKVTPNTTPEKFKYVPIQDFTNNSDIDWSKSITEIDLQLYKKYNLSSEEIDFIETHVKEME